jgi:phosphoglycolate phosphatase
VILMSQAKFPIIFDLDGTLFDCKALTNETFPKTLHILEQRYLNEIKINHFPNYEQFLGMVTEEIFTQLLPNANDRLINEAKQILVDVEFELIPKFGKLFPHVEEVLRELNANGYPLFVASNGSKEYVNKVIEVFSLEKYFTAIYSAGGEATKTKTELLKLLLDTYAYVDKGVMVGDRHSDIEAGNLNQLTTIGCKYGFGDSEEISDANVIIQDIQDILHLLIT